ncbi:hypothetical protein TWF281_007507 [Arthrobotrys megalospora]
MHFDCPEYLDLVEPIIGGKGLPEFASPPDCNINFVWPCDKPGNYQDGALHNQFSLAHRLEFMRTGHLTGFGTASGLSLNLYDNTTSPQLSLSDVTSPTSDILEGVVATSPAPSPTPYLASPLPTPPAQTAPPSHETPESLPEVKNGEEIELVKADFKPQVIEITIEQAMENRSKRQAMKGKTSRSEKKRRADQARIEKNESGVKRRKNGRTTCPEHGCGITWSNDKEFQNHLSSHGIKLFVCGLCAADFASALTGPQDGAFLSSQEEESMWEGTDQSSSYQPKKYSAVPSPWSSMFT